MKNRCVNVFGACDLTLNFVSGEIGFRFNRAPLPEGTHSQKVLLVQTLGVLWMLFLKGERIL